MKTILVDDEPAGLAQFEYECRSLEGIELVGKFESAGEALDFAGRNAVEFALLDIEMPGMDGLELGRSLRELNPGMILIYVTAHSRYLLETLKLRADYCVMKPYNRRDIEDAVERARLLGRRLRPFLRVKTFGYFEVYHGQKPIYFGNKKAKELLAVCVDREGAVVEMEEVIDRLWPDRPYDERVKRLYRKAVAALGEVLEQEGLSQIFMTKRGACFVVRERIHCDLYRFLDGSASSHAEGELLKEKGYLFEYSWAEERYAKLMARRGQLRPK